MTGVLAPETPEPSPGTDRARRLWRWSVTDVRNEADAAEAAYRTVTSSGTTTRNAAVILVTTAVCLTIANFWADASSPSWLTSSLEAVGLDGLAADLDAGVTTSGRREFNRLLWWSLVQIGSYVVLPFLVIRFVLRGRLRDFGLRRPALGSHVLPYVLIVAVAIPFVVGASFAAGFQAKYPFYDLAPAEGLWPYLWWWWGLYAVQFVALEFFFRGFLLHGLVPRLGYVSLFVMLVPYNMIHYGKPMPEAFAAIVGGFVLGTLSLRTRSIWWGAAVHISIAGTMDVLALTHAGVLF